MVAKEKQATRKDSDCQGQDRKVGQGRRRCTELVLNSRCLGVGEPLRQRGGQEKVVHEDYARPERKPSWPELQPDSQN